jgi:putative redox protein
MDAKVSWHGRMSFTGSADSGFDVPLGTVPAVGGDNDGFRPLELMGVSLAGCTAMDVISILTKMRQEVTRFDVMVHTDRADNHPKVFTKAVITYMIVGHNIDEKSVARAIELSASIYCPAQNMLKNAFPTSLLYEIYEGDGEENTELINKGEVVI